MWWFADVVCFLLCVCVCSRKKEWAKTLDKQVAELRARKAREGASMNDTEIRFNRLAMEEADNHFKRYPRAPPREVEIKTQPW